MRAADEIPTVAVVSLSISLISITLARTHARTQTRLAPPRQVHSHRALRPPTATAREIGRLHHDPPAPRPEAATGACWQIGSPGRDERARLQVLLHHQKGGDPRAQGGAQLPVQGHPPYPAVSPVTNFSCDLLCPRIGWPGSQIWPGCWVPTCVRFEICRFRLVFHGIRFCSEDWNWR